MTFIKDERGIASALAYAMFVIVAMGIIWMVFGVGVSEILTYANEFAADGLLPPLLLGTIKTIFMFFAWFPILVLVSVGLYILRRSQKRGSEEF